MTDRDRLSEERDFLLESLRDLERERAAGDIDDGDYQALRDDYTVRAARIIRELEEGEEPLVRRTSTWRKVVSWSIVVALIASGAGWLVAAQSGQRLPGQTITGGIEDSTASILSQARAINFEDPALAIELYGRVLELDPDNVEALTYRAWLVSLIARDTADDVRAMQQLVREVPVADHVVRYALRLVRSTRQDESQQGNRLKVMEYVSWGAGPRASQFLVLAAKARALLAGSPAATADDVRAVARPVLRHRIQLNFNAQADRVGVDQVIEEMLRGVPLEDPSAPGARELDRLVKPAGA